MTETQDGPRGRGRIDEQRRHFEELHREGEPWAFSERGVERYRHRRTADLVRALLAERAGSGSAARTTQPRVLEIGCSLGEMTARIAERLAEPDAGPRAALYATDLSPSAVRRARARWHGARALATPTPGFFVGSATELPLPPRSFDVIVAADGLFSWQLPDDVRAAVLREIHDALAPGGRAVFTDHMRPVRFPEFVAAVRAGPLRVERVMYMHDRPSYQFEGLIKAIQHWPVARALRRSEGLARALSVVGTPFGAAGSRHICVVAARDA